MKEITSGSNHVTVDNQYGRNLTRLQVGGYSTPVSCLINPLRPSVTNSSHIAKNFIIK